MEIYAVKDRTPELLDSLINVWENSVKATHDFLSGDEIAKIKLYVRPALQSIRNLIIAEENGKPVAFIGTECGKTEMLFVLNEKRGQGIGKRLINYAIDKYSAKIVTVNEQNPQAVGFYEHLGFEVYKRTETDEQGNPYPPAIYARQRKN